MFLPERKICAAVIGAILVLFAPAVFADAAATPSDGSEACIACHSSTSPALVMDWQSSRHAAAGVGCLSCHAVSKSDVRAGNHNGFTVTDIVTPKDCSKCHQKEYDEFEVSHHAKAGDIMASLDNVLAEKAAGMPGNIADASDACWQCHGSTVKFQKDAQGKMIYDSETGFPKLLASSWPNSGIGRLNPDGSKGSCNACHSKHNFSIAMARSPESCGKCHLGPDHPQAEIYAESKHGIAFAVNRDKMNLDKEGDWVLGKDYSAAPTCATCHVGSYTTADGTVVPSSHDVGARISWTNRPIVSAKINRVVFTDGFEDDYPSTQALPAIGAKLETTENRFSGGKYAPAQVTRTVAKIITWQERRDTMKGVCLNCHGVSQVNNFYDQYDDLVNLYDDKFAKIGNQLMNDLLADKVLKANAPYEKKLQWTWYELWHHEGRRARMGASMMGPDYVNWHGMYEVAQVFYTGFLPEVIDAAADVSPAMKKKYEDKVAAILARPENQWIHGLTPEQAKALKDSYLQKYGD